MQIGLLMIDQQPDTDKIYLWVKDQSINCLLMKGRKEELKH